jgi:hypothetical protein
MVGSVSIGLRNFKLRHYQLFGLYSLTTLDTPNLGSSLGDLLVAAHKVPLLQLVGILSLDPTFVAALLRSTEGAEDLQVQAAIANNNKWGAAPGQYTVDGVQNNANYYAFGANADVNGNLKIDGASIAGDAVTRPDEGYPPPLRGALSVLNRDVQNQRFQWLGTIKKGNIHSLRILGRTIISIADFDPTPAFQLNDTTVTVASALGAPGFSQPAGTQICNGLPCLLANHTTTGSSMSWDPVAQQVLSLIQAAQPMQ